MPLNMSRPVSSAYYVNDTGQATVRKAWQELSGCYNGVVEYIVYRKYSNSTANRQVEAIWFGDGNFKSCGIKLAEEGFGPRYRCSPLQRFRKWIGSRRPHSFSRSYSGTQHFPSRARGLSFGSCCSPLCAPNSIKFSGCTRSKCSECRS